jgi:hypothetical protein
MHHSGAKRAAGMLKLVIARSVSDDVATLFDM